MRGGYVCAVMLAVASNLRLGEAGLVEGSYRGSDTWIFLDRFCFNPTKTGDDRMGSFEGTFSFPVSKRSTPVLMLFYKGGEELGVQKEFGFWERAYYSETTCVEKAEIASQRGGIYMPLPGDRPITKYNDSQGVEHWSVTVKTTMATSRARWMFISLGNCQPNCQEAYCSNALDFSYSLNLTNGAGLSMYFSADKTWFIETAICFSILYSLLLAFALYTRYKLKAIHKYHYSVQLLVASIVFGALSQYFYLIFYITYSGSGRASPVVESIGAALGLFQEYCLLLMTILVAKGWTIVRKKISALGRVRLAAYMTTYVIVSIACWVYYGYFSDPAAIVYIYSTIPGGLLVMLRLFAFIWFTYAIYVTLRKYRQSRGFYKKFWFFVGTWILTIPILVFVNSMIDVWFRAKIVNLISILSTFVCQLVLIAMYNPKYCCGTNGSFPFHATTNTFMLKKKSDLPKGSQAIEGSNTFEEAHILRAFQISSQMRHSVVMLQSYTNDLHSFLENIKQIERATKKNDIETGIYLPVDTMTPGPPSTTHKIDSTSSFKAGNKKFSFDAESVSTSDTAPNTVEQAKPKSNTSKKSVRERTSSFDHGESTSSKVSSAGDDEDCAIPSKKEKKTSSSKKKKLGPKSSSKNLELVSYDGADGAGRPPSGRRKSKTKDKSIENE